ncbi:GTP-binding protein YPTM1, putative [Trichomonas vaginalis G3]|uniref:GTP-binding protein YPTM1, putative n=1 Tax=Trichomonas vaginalis (strain ATCC PRA-98 / G3) TaxID=412133 RepID=A2E7L0_TRIV3|nr:GTPase protein [Trichomonas vaginalis G3]EAY11403.1 GTP-binding protein YPTM1, putative [Trichomonas vaginalis G3]KAI5530582.1 GTPase protein [Trichomonas vaginalis G3]|eukprot:XP_001323626.1 GTP-binding protein YPTM1 [Trichomonas vaginalis G3]
MTSSEFDLLYKILIIGDSAVGKSSILLQFSDQTFSDNYVSTIGVDFKIRTLDVDGKQVKLQIWDTAGQERFQSIVSNYYHGSHAIALVYDITDRKSFENLRKWVSDVDRLANKQVCRIIVGNKTDLSDKRAVRRDEGQAFADSLGVPFIETSAKTANNIQQLFIQMCQAVSRKFGLQSPRDQELDQWTLRPGQSVGKKGCC